MTNDTQSAEVARLRAALQEIIDVHKNVPIKMNSPPFLRMTWIANRRREIAELALSEQPQPTGRTDSARLNGLRKLMGFVEDGSSQTVAISQDDATKEFIIHAGKRRWFHGYSLREAIDAAIDNEKEAE